MAPRKPPVKKTTKSKAVTIKRTIRKVENKICNVDHPMCKPHTFSFYLYLTDSEGQVEIATPIIAQNLVIKQISIHFCSLQASQDAGAVLGLNLSFLNHLSLNSNIPYSSKLPIVNDFSKVMTTVHPDIELTAPTHISPYVNYSITNINGTTPLVGLSSLFIWCEYQVNVL